MAVLNKFTAVISNNTNIDMVASDLFSLRFSALFSNADANIKMFNTVNDLILNYTPGDVDDILLDMVYDTAVDTTISNWAKSSDLNINIVFRYTNTDSYMLTSGVASVTTTDDKTKNDKYRVAYTINGGAVKYLNNVTGNVSNIKLDNQGSIEFSDGVSQVKIFMEPVTLPL